jgi:hypothetical protein
MAKLNNDKTLAKSTGEGWDAWGASCGFTSWRQAADAIGITVAQIITIRKKAPRKTIRLAMDAVLLQRLEAEHMKLESAMLAAEKPAMEFSHGH